VTERGRIVGDACHRAAEHAQLDGGQLGGGGLEVLEDRLRRAGRQVIDEHLCSGGERRRRGLRPSYISG
jgi:hypothetical protein